MLGRWHPHTAVPTRAVMRCDAMRCDAWYCRSSKRGRAALRFQDFSSLPRGPNLNAGRMPARELSEPFLARSSRLVKASREARVEAEWTCSLRCGLCGGGVERGASRDRRNRPSRRSRRTRVAGAFRREKDRVELVHASAPPLVISASKRSRSLPFYRLTATVLSPPVRASAHHSLSDPIALACCRSW